MVPFDMKNRIFGRCLATTHRTPLWVRRRRLGRLGDGRRCFRVWGCHQNPKTRRGATG
jgi:hypothetical protein